MNKENTEKLWKRFSKMFRGKDKSIQESLIPFGFEHGDGWFQIIWDLCMSIEGLHPTEEFEVMQVKEKFGTLRFYTSCSSEEIEDEIDKAETLSGKTCEWCGEFAKVRGKGWLVTLCEGCWEMYQDGKRR